MEQPYLLLALLAAFAFGIFFKWVWDVSYNYKAFNEERKPPTAKCVYKPCVRCDCDKDLACCDGECSYLKDEVQMMQDAKRGDPKC